MLTAPTPFRVRKRALDGAMWRGEAQIWREESRVILDEQGAWAGVAAASTQRLVWDASTLTVGTGAAAHLYTLTPDAGGLRGRYVCGNDIYGFWGPALLPLHPAAAFWLRWWVNIDTPPTQKTVKQWALVAHYIPMNEVK